MKEESTNCADEIRHKYPNLEHLCERTSRSIKRVVLSRLVDFPQLSKGFKKESTIILAV